MNEIADRTNEYLKSHYPATWLAVNHHRTHKNKPITFKNYEYLRGPFLDEADWIAVIKSTQNGFTEWATMKVLAKALQMRSVFYVLPTGALKDRYVKNRLDRSVQFTPFYQEVMYNEERMRLRGRFSESMSLKHFGGGTIAFVGSNSAASFTEFPADDVVIDELDQCDQKNILMAEERLSNSEDPRRIYISNPTVDGYGIDTYWKQTDQKEWFIKCDHCGHWHVMDWFQTVVDEITESKYRVRDAAWDPDGDLDIRVMCPRCAKPNNRFVRGEWVKKYANRKKSGYHISKVFSSRAKLSYLMDNFIGGLSNEEKMERFWNADLGLPYTGKGSKITLAEIEALQGDYPNETKHPKNACIMGIDVGRRLNIVIGYIMDDGRVKVGAFLETPVEVPEVMKLVREYGVNVAVVDAQPEGHFVNKLKAAGPFFACFYGDTAQKREPVDKFRNITVGRTESLDAAKEHISTSQLIFPMNTLTIPNVVQQLTAATRIFDPDKNKGRGGYRWTEGAKADHYHHGLNYMLVARRLLVLASNQG